MKKKVITLLLVSISFTFAIGEEVRNKKRENYCTSNQAFISKLIEDVVVEDKITHIDYDIFINRKNYDHNPLPKNFIDDFMVSILLVSDEGIIEHQDVTERFYNQLFMQEESITSELRIKKKNQYYYFLDPDKDSNKDSAQYNSIIGRFKLPHGIYQVQMNICGEPQFELNGLNFAAFGAFFVPMWSH